MFTRKVLIVGLAFLLSAAAGPVRAAPLQLALWPPVQLVAEDTDVKGLRINLPYGHNRDVVGLDLGLVNTASRDVVGLQLGVGLNDAGYFHDPAAPGRLAGAQLGLLINSAGAVAGFQASPVLNLARGDLDGVQLAWWVNIAQGDTRGLQAGLANVTGGDARGAQLAVALVAALNVAREVRGAQVSVGALSMNRAESVSGLQLNAGLVGNLADDVDGVQLAATCNLARRVRGLQLGLVNYCRSLSGLQLGLVNIVAESRLPACPLVGARF